MNIYYTPKKVYLFIEVEFVYEISFYLKASI